MRRRASHKHREKADRSGRPDFRPVREKSLDELEGVWGEPDYPTFLVQECHRLHRVPLKEFTVENLRITIGQKIGLPWLVPMAPDELERDPLVSGSYFEGDLLTSVLGIPDDFWTERPRLRSRLLSVLDDAARRFAADEDTGDHLRVVIRDAASRFR